MEQVLDKRWTLNLEVVRAFIRASAETSRIYIGCDSERFKKNGKWYADYCVAICIHKDGNKGAKVFGSVVREPDYDAKAGKPALRLMNEVTKAVEVFEALYDAIGYRHVELHLDINGDDRFGSSCVVASAIGYVRGMCGFDPQIKPEAFAASICADRLKQVLEHA